MGTKLEFQFMALRARQVALTYQGNTEEHQDIKRWNKWQGIERDF